LVAKALWESWLHTKDQNLQDTVVGWAAGLIDPAGEIDQYRLSEYNIDNINCGKVLFDLEALTGEPRYRHALVTIRSQLTSHPRTRSGGFWHKGIYPHQMWLDGLYMAAPFYAQYAALHGPSSDFSDVVHQFTLIESKARDKRTGLLYHGWDESCGMKWADAATGCSPHFWGRAVGWFAMALVDTLDWIPEGHPGHQSLLGILRRLAEAIVAFQDPAGLWWQVLDRPQQPGNYRESSASAMVVYSLAKAVRKGWVNSSYASFARRGWAELVRTKIVLGDSGWEVRDACSVAGLGGNPYRDGSFQYYVSEPQRVNDAKALGPAVLAAWEISALDAVHAPVS
jgi:unsaturated rhamnogalacturonyl hydrolase